MKKMGKKQLVVLFYIIMMLPFFKITYLTRYKFVNTFNNILLGICICFDVIMLIKKKRMSKILVCISAFLLILFGSTVINKGAISECVKLVLEVLAFSIFMDIGIRYDTKKFLFAVSLYLRLVVEINFITLFMFPKGMYRSNVTNYRDNWLLGFKNLHVLYIFPANLISFIYSNKYFKKIRMKDYMFLILSLISLIRVNSTTAIVGLVLVGVYMSTNKVFNIKICNIFTYIVSYFFVYIGVICFNIQILWEDLIYKIFKKSASFTNRIQIWDDVMKFIEKKKLIGYGQEYSNYRYNKSSEFKCYHAHNEMLEVIYKTGIIGLIAFLFIIFIASHELYIYKEDKNSKIISIFLFIFLIMMLTEFYNFIYIMYIFIFAYNVKHLLIKQDGVGNEKKDYVRDL